MVNIRKKHIKEKDYLYAEYSFRSPAGKVKKISKYIREKQEAYDKDVEKYFTHAEEEEYIKYAKNKYKTDSVLTLDKIKKIEKMRFEYIHIMRKLNFKQIKDILDRFTVNFTYESNAIEGNSLTLKDVALILHENISLKQTNLREVYEARNAREVNELLFAKKIKIDIASIIKMHSTLMRDTGVMSGFKKYPNFLLMRNLKTTPPEKVDYEMNRLIEWYHKSKEDIHPLKIASEFHGRFEQIHPFEDGNGRIGRILINAILIDCGYPPLIVRKNVKSPYLSALEAFDNKYPVKLERFLVSKFEETFEKFFRIYVKYL